MNILINKEKLLDAFVCKSDDYDVLTEKMIDDLLDSELLDDFKINYPESYAHYERHFKEEIDIENPTCDDIVLELYWIIGMWDEDDEY